MESTKNYEHLREGEITSAFGVWDKHQGKGGLPDESWRLSQILGHGDVEGMAFLVEGTENLKTQRQKRTKCCEAQGVVLCGICIHSFTYSEIFIEDLICTRCLLLELAQWLAYMTKDFSPL